MKSEAILWAAIAIGPIAWFVSLEANFALAPLACTGRGKLFLYAASGLSIILSLAAIGASFRQRQLASSDAMPPQDRSRRGGMALAGLGLSFLSFLAILAQAIPSLLMGGCE